MRLVLSRKGFDARHGGMASPILPDGTLLPLPIPHPADATTLSRIPLPVPAWELEPLLRDLSRGRLDAGATVHADPWLVPPAQPLPGWRPSLGQAGAAARHLLSEGVGPGDLFLFFGWFRRVRQRQGRWCFEPGAPDQHLIFGWLEVGEVLAPGQDPAPCLAALPWLAAHPHRLRPDLRADPRNSVYVAPERSRFAGVRGPGGGRFLRLTPERLLTAPAARGRSLWRLPGWFLPPEGPPLLSYHRNPALWQRRGPELFLRSARIGQEFVLELPARPGPRAWLETLIADGD